MASCTLSVCVTQVQYEFGLRSITRLLRVLSAMKACSPVDSEHVLVVRAVRHVNLAQLADRDEPLFLSLVNDLFPGIILDETCHPSLEEALAKQLDSACLVNHSPWTFKLMQVTFNVTCNNNNNST